MAAVPAGRAVHWKGTYYNVRMSNYGYPAGDTLRVPVFLTGVRPGMIRVAAEVADGFLGHPAFTPRWIAGVVRPALQAGMASRPGSRGSLRIVARVAVAVALDRTSARDRAREHVAELATGRSYEEVFSHAGFGPVLPGLRAAARDEAARLVTDDMVDAFAVSGSPGEAAERLVERMHGVDEIIIMPTGDADRFLEALRLLAVH
jgi:alkanesulfonate monooxygenase SsuD/methylene tetrahydromethanopterin reductase-like flavin-dependent oxidoreductase (luciferase family)